MFHTFIWFRLYPCVVTISFDIFENSKLQIWEPKIKQKITRIDSETLLESVCREKSNVTVCGSSTRCQNWRVTWTPAYGLYGSFVLVEFHKLFTLLMRIYNQFIVVSSWSYVMTIGTPPKTTNFLSMRLILVHNSTSKIPCGYTAISWSASQEPTRPIKTSNSSTMALKIIIFFSFWRYRILWFAQYYFQLQVYCHHKMIQNRYSHLGC